MKLIICAFIFVILSTQTALARTAASVAKSHGGGPFGLGIELGIPTGLSGKLWLANAKAIDMGLAFMVSDHMIFWGDYLIHYPGAFRSESKFINQLTPYFGFGALIAFTTSSRNSSVRYLGKASGSLGVGARVPVGIEWSPARPPIGVFFEIIPGISVMPETTTMFQAGLGIRYFF